MGEHLDDLWGGEMTVPADEDMGPGPVAPQRGQKPDQDIAFSAPIGRLPGRRQAVTRA